MTTAPDPHDGETLTVSQPAPRKRSHKAPKARSAPMPAEQVDDTSPERDPPHRLRGLMEQAHRLRATLTVVSSGALVIRRGSSSWHCTDPTTAAAILDRMEASR